MKKTLKTIVTRPIPSSVEFDEEGNTKLRFKKSSKKKATAAPLVTPTSPSHSFLRRTFSPRRSRPCSKESDSVPLSSKKKFPDADEASSSAVSSVASARLGIQRTSYEAPIDLPLSLANLATNNSDEEENEIVFEDSGDDSPNTKQQNLTSPTVFDTAWKTEASSKKKNKPYPRVVMSLQAENQDPNNNGDNTNGDNNKADSPEKILHRPTSMGHYLSSPVTTTSLPIEQGLRYSMDQDRAVVTKKQQQEQDTSVKKAKKVRVKESRVLWTKTLTERRSSESSFKIFLLLLAPKSKIFELIQLLYPSSTSTIGDILDMIPNHATEPALGSQTYTGLTRPKKKHRVEFTNLAQLASSHKRNKTSAGIVRGEILVAIPEGYTGEHVVGLAKNILANPRIQKLLQRSNPLAPPKKSKSKRKSRSSSVSVSLESVEESVEEEEEEQQVPDNTLQDSLQRAMMKAALANAEVPTAVAGIPPAPPVLDGYLSDQSSLRSTASRRPGVGGRYEEDSSIEGSMSSRPHHLRRHKAVSFASYSRDRVISTARYQRARRTKLTGTLKRIVLAVVGLMMARYWTDPNGFAAAGKEASANAPMGLVGLLQLALPFVILLKLQLFATTNVDPEDSKCPFMQGSAMLLVHRRRQATECRHNEY